MSKALLITGATGKQGGAVIDALLDANADFEILAVTRSAESDTAQELLQRSSKIKLVQGNLDRVTDLFKNAKKATELPIWGVFSVQTFMGSGQTVESEEKQGKELIDESIKEGVKFFVYTSVDRGGQASFDNPTHVPHFASKHHIEHHLIDKSGNGEMDWTILRPTAFFDNITPNFMGRATVTMFSVVLRDKPVQWIATSDIGHFGAEAFLKPEEFKGKAISLAGDNLNFEELSTVFKAKTGKNLPTTFKLLCNVFIWGLPEVGSMFKWFQEAGYKADIEEVKRMYPELKDFGAWLEKDSELMER